MKKIDLKKVHEDYADFKKSNREELLQSAVAAIDPDAMNMTREQAMTLAGAMKACGLSQADYAAVMEKSTYDKGTFAKQWNKWRGSGTNGNCTEGTIYEYAKQCGWKWPTPTQDEKKIPQGKKKDTPPALQFMKKFDKDYKISVLFDTQEYTSKPGKPTEIRNREQTPTPAPEPIIPQDMARAIATGRTHYPTVYNKIQTGTDDKGKPIYEYIPIQQQVFEVDIDNEEPALDENGNRIKGQKRRIDNPLTIDAALNICRENGIYPTVYYETFSSKEHREDPNEPYQKFRLVFAMDTPVTIRKYGEIGLQKIRNYFITLFGKAADTSITDPARLIYGTDERDRTFLTCYIIDSKKLIPQIFKAAPETDGKLDTIIKQLQDYYKEIVKTWETEAPVFENGDRQPFMDYMTEDERLDKLDALLVKLGVDKETHDKIAHTINEAAANETYGTAAPAFSELFKDLPGSEAIQPETEPEPLTPSEEVDQFLQTIITEQYKPIPTGITDIDKILHGGLIRQQLVMLTAAPGLGKTTLAQQIIEKMAQNGNPALYFNLEMSKEQMLARSLARISCSELTALQILQAYNLDNAARDQIREAAEIYKRNIAAHITYNPQYIDEDGKRRETGADLDNIIKAMRQTADKAIKEGKQAPIVCVDYLHLLHGDTREDATSIIKRAVEDLKQYAIDYNSIVLLISASNRTANKTGKASIDSGRDTSNIEYQGDLLLTLNYRESDRADGETAEEIADKIKSCREKGLPIPEEYTLFSLRIVKGRFTEAYQQAVLKFDGQHSRFIQQETHARTNPLYRYKTQSSATIQPINEARATVKKNKAAREHKKQDYMDAYNRLKENDTGEGVTISAMADELGVSQATVRSNIKDLLPGVFMFNNEVVNGSDADITLAANNGFIDDTKGEGERTFNTD